MDTSTLDAPPVDESNQEDSVVDVSQEIPTGEAFESFLDDYKSNIPDEPVEKQAQAAPAAPPAVDPEEAEDGDDKTAARFRLTANNPRDVAVFAVMKANRGLSYEQAATQLFGAPAAPAAPATADGEDPTTEGTAPGLDTVEAIDAKKKELRSQLKTATAAFDFETVAEIQEQLFNLEDLRPEILTKQAQAALAKDQELEKAWAEQGARTVALYPDSNVPDSPLVKLTNEIIDAMEANGDPLLGSPDSVLRVTQMAAARLGIAPVMANSTQPPVRQQQQAPLPVRMRPAAGQPTGGATPLAEEAVQRTLKAMSLEELTAFGQSYANRQG